jgi:hypothetical protein
MDFNATIDLIIKDLIEASEIIDDLKKYPGVPVLQVELAKAKCRSAGDVIALLKNEGDLKPEKGIVVIEPPAESRTSEKKAVAPSTLADTFDNPPDLYTEQTASLKTEKDISDQLKSKPIASIAEAIGISDKFLFIGEIFDGNKETYAQAISKLDKAQDLTEALSIISSYTGENTESEAVSQLLDLVKLKLASNE